MYEINVEGIVQGVGFRPFIYNQANKKNIKGFVQNTNNGVKIVCNNKKLMIEILKNPPKLAKIQNIKIKKIRDIKLEKIKNFTIKKSENINSYSPIPADLNTCNDCIKELFEKNNYRENYFFISCTNCGPRYSIINTAPYDRKNTTLKDFEMCSICKQEYENPKNRRYHAQTIACNHCGPKITLYHNNKPVSKEIDAIKQVLQLLKQNQIIAIKGIGGFHLACSSENSAILKLKQLTNRYHKPFALMVKDLEMVKKYVNVNEVEEKILLSNKRPIVLLEKKDKSNLTQISELSSLGIMLAYSPTHYLLFEDINFPIVFTSSNMPSFPITTTKEEQFVEYVLDYNREIANSVDDSIIKVVNNKPLIIRRSRGYSPEEIFIGKNYLNNDINNLDIISVGAELKNTFCIKKNNKLILSQHIGNTYNLENFNNFKNTFLKLIEFTKTKPSVIICDKSLNFNTSEFAQNYAKENNIELFKVQHHIAHAFSCAIEHNLKEFIAIVCDGTGIGDDNKVWGGEVFYNDKRIGHLEYQSLVGADIANKEPLRMLVGILTKFMSLEEIENLLGKNLEIKTYYKQKKENFNCIDTSSAGRYLDCVSILLGFSDKNYYEGRAAMILESNCSDKVKLFFEPIIEINNDIMILKTTSVFEFIVKNINKISKQELARFAHIYLAKGLYEIANNYNIKKKIKTPILFSGGVAYNKIITNYMIKKNVLLNKEIPSGDGGISAGQIAYYLWTKNK